MSATEDVNALDHIQVLDHLLRNTDSKYKAA